MVFTYRKRIFQATWLLLLLCSIHGMAMGQPTRLIRDMGGRSVRIPDKIKSVYVNNHCDILVYAFDPAIAVNRITKISDAASRFFPKQFLAKPVTDPQGALEEIIKLHPDVVLWSVEVSPQAIDEANRLQAKINIPVVLLELNMTKYKATFAFLGQLLSRPAKAQELIGFVKTYIDAIQQRARQIPANRRVRIYYAESPDGLSTDPSGSKHSQIIDFVGASNVAKVGIAPGTGLAKVSMEQVMIWQPEVILVWTVNADRLVTYKHILSDPLWKNIRAVKSGRVYQIPWLPFGWFDRPPGPNRIPGTIWTANLLYPAIFKYDMVKVTQEYFQKFYHVHLSAAQAKTVLNPKPQL